MPRQLPSAAHNTIAVRGSVRTLKNMCYHHKGIVGFKRFTSLRIKQAVGWQLSLSSLPLHIYPPLFFHLPLRPHLSFFERRLISISVIHRWRTNNHLLSQVLRLPPHSPATANNAGAYWEAWCVSRRHIVCDNGRAQLWRVTRRATSLKQIANCLCSHCNGWTLQLDARQQKQPHWYECVAQWGNNYTNEMRIVFSKDKAIIRLGGRRVPPQRGLISQVTHGRTARQHKNDRGDAIWTLHRFREMEHLHFYI